MQPETTVLILGIKISTKRFDAAMQAARDGLGPYPFKIDYEAIRKALFGA
jgi:hypothetical protein